MQGFVLHKRRFKETSLIVEFLTLERGRIATIVKGALRAKSKVGNSLQHSMRLELDVIGKSNLPTLTRVEVIEHFPNLKGLKAFTLLYVNELIIKFFGENDPIKDVYRNYAELQRTLGGTGDYQSALRYFELTIFEAMGVQPAERGGVHAVAAWGVVRGAVAEQPAARARVAMMPKIAR